MTPEVTNNSGHLLCRTVTVHKELNKTDEIYRYRYIKYGIYVFIQGEGMVDNGYIDRNR